MPQYSISDLEKLTGIKAHTLRAWEYRYGIVVPKRTGGNVRYYHDEDLCKLLNVALLNRNGLRISQIAKMSEQERTREVADLSTFPISTNTPLDALTLSTLELDAFKFGHILAAHVEQRGFESTMLEIVYPFLDKLGLLYFTGNVSVVQEAFVGNLIRQKVLAATEELSVTPPDERRPTFALYLAPGERQELSLLFVQYLLLKRGFRVLYLGQNVSAPDLGKACKLVKFEYLYTAVSNTFVSQPLREHLRDVNLHCPEATLLVSGRQVVAHLSEETERIVPVHSLLDLRNFLDGAE